MQIDPLTISTFAIILALLAIVCVGVAVIISIILWLKIIDHVARVPEILNKMYTISNELKNISAMTDFVNDFDDIQTQMMDMNNKGNPNKKFRSIDGKHEADTLDELLDKMRNDPDNKVSDEELHNIQDMFKENTVFDSDDEDDEDDIEDWKKKK